MILISKRQKLTLIKADLNAVLNNNSMPELSLLYEQLSNFDISNSDSEYIKYEVFNLLSYLSGEPVGEISEGHNIKFDLGINNYEKRLFRRKFNEVLKELGSSKKITMEECLNVEFVIDCINLIESKLS